MVRNIQLWLWIYIYIYAVCMVSLARLQLHHSLSPSLCQPEHACDQEMLQDNGLHPCHWAIKFPCDFWYPLVIWDVYGYGSWLIYRWFTTRNVMFHSNVKSPGGMCVRDTRCGLPVFFPCLFVVRLWNLFRPTGSSDFGGQRVSWVSFRWGLTSRTSWSLELRKWMLSGLGRTWLIDVWDIQIQLAIWRRTLMKQVLFQLLCKVKLIYSIEMFCSSCGL